ncbi:MAG: 50S ribosomal protein L29 [Tannerella sp.]|jgi:large subunit ribosomal protein L29|nr:50S ribosomal protein L29 [Tannerella sp.]
MKIKEIKELSAREIDERIEAERLSLAQKKINHSISPLDNPAQIKEQRKTIARLLTERHQRKQNNK